MTLGGSARNKEVRMSAVKALALSALVLIAASRPVLAGPLSQSDLNWTAWTPAGLVQAPATTGSLFGLGNSPDVSTTPPASMAPAVATTPAAAVTAAASTPAATTSPATASAAPAKFDAFVNLGSGNYSDAANLTQGGAQAWYNSSTVASLFGGSISAQQQASFDAAVLQRVQQTFNLAGVPISLTDNPNAPAAHTLSVVSGTTSSWGPVLGLTNIGGNGFDFIDQAARYSQSVDQLEWVVAHNVSHELMLAFGVPEHYDQTGNYIDARDANLSMMLNPSATFSQSAAQALLSQNFQVNVEGTNQGPQYIGAQTVVPEPATIAAWSLALGGIAVARARRPRRSA
jgi:hypothetical protein